MEIQAMREYVRSDARSALSARIRGEERQLTKLRKAVLKAPGGSDERVHAAMELTHARTRLEALKEAWLIVTGEVFS